jgi:hypothetical protein
VDLIIRTRRWNRGDSYRAAGDKQLERAQPTTGGPQGKSLGEGLDENSQDKEADRGSRAGEASDRETGLSGGSSVPDRLRSFLEADS